MIDSTHTPPKIKKRAIQAIPIAALIAVPILVTAYSDVPPAGYAGVPGENGTCTGCHRVTAGTGNVQIIFPGGTNYTPGVPQTLQVIITDAVAKRWGFEATARLASNTATQEGTFTSTDGNTAIFCADDSVRPTPGACPATAPQEFIGQRASGSQAGKTGSGVFNFTWTPPATNVGPIAFYVSGLAANNSNSNSGDTTYTANYTLTPAAPASPSLTATPSSLTFSYQIGGAAPAAQMVSVASSGAVIAFTSSATTISGGNWLSASPASGNTPGSLSVSVNPAGLAAGTYTGTVSIASSGASNSPQTVAATLNVLPAPVLPTLSVSPASLSFNYQIGGAAAPSQSLSVASSGAALSFTAAASGGAWLSATPASGMTPGSASVSVNPASMAAGTYNGSVTISSAGASNSVTVPVTLTITAAPTMSVSPATLAFAFQIGGATPAAKTVSVGGNASNFTVAASGGTWLSATPASGTIPGSVSVSVNPAGMAAGTYNGTVTVSAAGASNSPQTVAVTLTITAAPTMSVSPSTLAFAFQIGGTTPAAQTISIGGTAANFTVAASGGTWLSATPASGTIPGSASVSVNPAGMAAGTYNGTVTVSAAGASNSPQTVAVTLTISAAPTVSASPATLAFAYQIGGTAPAAKTISVAGTAPNFTVAASGGTWLSATPASGAIPGSVSVSVNPAGMAAGTYNGTVTVSAAGAGNSPQTVAVTLTVTAAPATTVGVSPATLAFAFQIGGTTPAAQTISVGGTAPNFTVAASGGTWLSATPASGTTPGSVSVSVNPAGMAAGTYTGMVNVSASGASNSPQTVAVTLTVTAAPATTVSVSPATLAFAFQIGGAAPAAKTISVAGTAPNFTVAASGGTWLSATPASGTTPGNVSVSVNPAGMAAGTYNGTVTIAAAGASNSPQTVSVTLTITSAVTSLQVSPGTMSFAYTAGGAAPAAQQIAVASSGAALNFTALTSGGAWLSATPASGTSPGSVSVSVNPTGLATGTYNGTVAIASAGAANSPQNVTVTLVVSAAGTPSLKISTNKLSLDQNGHGTIDVTSTGAPLAFTASALGGHCSPWLSLSPGSLTTPATLTVSADTAGLASGGFFSVITLCAPGATNPTVSVAVTYGNGGSDDGAGTKPGDDFAARPLVTGKGTAQWVPGAGVPASGQEASNDSGLLLSKSGSSESGVVLDHVAGSTLRELGFDLHSGVECGAASPLFKVVTDDNVEHLVGSCDASAVQPSPSEGWTRYRFDVANSAHAVPVIAPYARVKSIHLVLGGDAGAVVVVDNIVVNSKGVNKQ